MTRIDVPAEITVYTLPWCPHCLRAKALLSQRRLPFREVDGTGVPDFRQRIATLTGGYTVPQIVIDGQPIGGASQLAALDRRGVLAVIAAREPFPIVREIRRISPRSVLGWVSARARGRRDVAAVQRIRLRIDRAGRIVDRTIPEALEEEPNGQGMRSTAG